jgi:ATP-dependent DNA helicase RecG
VSLYREATKSTEDIGNSISLTVQEQKIVAFLKEHGGIVRTKDAKSVLDVEERRAREILKDLADKQIIEKKGRGPSTFYELK